MGGGACWCFAYAGILMPPDTESTQYTSSSAVGSHGWWLGRLADGALERQARRAAWSACTHEVTHYHHVWSQPTTYQPTWSQLGHNQQQPEPVSRILVTTHTLGHLSLGHLAALCGAYSCCIQQLLQQTVAAPDCSFTRSVRHRFSPVSVGFRTCVSALNAAAA